MAVRKKAKYDPISARNRQQEDEERRLQLNKEYIVHQLRCLGFFVGVLIHRRTWGWPRLPGRHVSGGPALGKSSNDESLTRNEGGGRNQHWQDATYRTVQGRQLRISLATATFFSRPWMQLRAGTGEL